MTNPFTGIISTEFKAIYVNAINSLLENNSLTMPCTLIYGNTKFTDCPNCFSSNTMIKMQDGYKAISDILIGEKVFNGKEYIRVNHVFQRLYYGPLYNIRCWGVSLPDHITPNHKIPVVRNFRKQYTKKQWNDEKHILQNPLVEEVPVCELTLDDAVVSPFYPINDIPLEIIDGPFDKPIDVDDDLLFFIGWWLAEGCLCVEKCTRVGQFSLCASKEEHIADKLADILHNKFNINSKKWFSNKVDSVVLSWYSAKLARFMWQFGHLSENKYIPLNLWKGLSLSQKRKLLLAYFDGDGHVENDFTNSIYNYRTLTTISKKLAHQTYDILYCLGLTPSISHRNACTDKYGINRQAIYYVVWTEDRKVQKSCVRKSNIGWLSKIRSITQTEDTIPVYNLDVDGTHKYIANNILVNNCIFDNATGKSSNQYQSGGPLPFNHGICGYCHGLGKIPTESTESVYLIAIWDSKQWIAWNSPSQTPNTPGMFVQTLSKLSTTFTNIKKAKSIIIDTTTADYTKSRFERYGEPAPMGFGDSSFVVAMWKKI